MDPNKQKIVDAIDGCAEELIQIAANLHANPEIAFQEVKARGWLTEFLARKGFSTSTPWGGLDTAFRAAAPHAKAGPRLAFICEYDALPGLGHACGHNLYAICGIGAGAGLAPLMDGLPGELWVVGTPAEEGGAGKIRMLEAGGFEGVNYALMAHAGVKNMVGRATMAGRRIVVEFQGRAAHTKEPWKGANALQAVLELFRMIDGLRGSFPDRCRINGIITDGGRGMGIPEFASAEFSVRAGTETDFNWLLGKFGNLVQAAEIATDTKATLKLGSMLMKNRRPNKIMDERFRSNMQELGERYAFASPFEPMGFSDAGNLSHALPLIHVYFKIADAGVSSHTPEFERVAGTREAAAIAVKVAKGLAMTGYDILSNEELRHGIDEEFRRSVKEEEGSAHDA